MNFFFFIPIVGNNVLAWNKNNRRWWNSSHNRPYL